MGTLTKKERESLEEVFLSIQTPSSLLVKIKQFLLYKHLKQDSLLIKDVKNLHFFSKIQKKKKNLSK